MVKACFLQRRFSGLSVTLCVTFVAGGALAAPPKSADKPREIVFDSAHPVDSGTPSKAPAPLTEDEQRAQDNALGAGAVDLEQTLHIGEASRHVEREFQVKAGRCYSISLAWKTPYRASVTYTLGRNGDGRPVNDSFSSDTGETAPREGVVQFCVDRAGPVRLEVSAEESAAQAELPHDYVLVIASRPETIAQKDARHRRAGVKPTTERTGSTSDRKSGTAAWKTQ